MIRYVGFYTEIWPGGRDGPIREWLAMIDDADRTIVANYLREAKTLVTTGQLVDDALDDDHKRVSKMELATDGEWVWPRALSYYVETYGVAVPRELVERIRRSPNPPALTVEQLSQVAGDVRSNPPD